MKRICAAFALLTCVIGLTAGAGSQSQYVTSMTFQDGVSPTAGYSGCAVTYIGGAVADSNLNHGACDSALVGATTNVRGEFQSLVKFDVSGLPDSAVVSRARLYMYTLNPSGSSAASDPLRLLRVYKSWNEGTGTCAGTIQATSADMVNRTGAAWAGPGLTKASTANESRYWGPGTSTSDSTTLGGNFFGADTVNTATTAVTVVDVAAFGSSGNPKSGSTAARRLGWVVFDVTQDIRQWHIGAVANNGWLLTNVDGTGTVTLSYASDDYGTFIHRRPKLIVEYINPETLEGSGGSVRRTVGRSR